MVEHDKPSTITKHNTHNTNKRGTTKVNSVLIVKLEIMSLTHEKERVPIVDAVRGNRCCVCRENVANLHRKGLSVFKFPVNRPLILDRWRAFAQLPEEYLSKSVICSKHFKSEDIFVHSVRTVVKRFAFPCLFPPESVLEFPDTMTHPEHLETQEEPHVTHIVPDVDFDDLQASDSQMLSSQRASEAILPHKLQRDTHIIPDIHFDELQVPKSEALESETVFSPHAKVVSVTSPQRASVAILPEEGAGRTQHEGPWPVSLIRVEIPAEEQSTQAERGTKEEFDLRNNLLLGAPEDEEVIWDTEKCWTLEHLHKGELPETLRGQQINQAANVSEIAEVREVTEVSKVASISKAVKVSEVAEVPKVSEVDQVAILSEPVVTFQEKPKLNCEAQIVDEKGEPVKQYEESERQLATVIDPAAVQLGFLQLLPNPAFHRGHGGEAHAQMRAEEQSKATRGDAVPEGEVALRSEPPALNWSAQIMEEDARRLRQYEKLAEGKLPFLRPKPALLRRLQPVQPQVPTPQPHEEEHHAQDPGGEAQPPDVPQAHTVVWSAEKEHEKSENGNDQMKEDIQPCKRRRKQVLMTRNEAIPEEDADEIIVTGVLNSDKRKNSAKAFLLEFVDLYRSSPALWKRKSRDYMNKEKKKCCYAQLLEQYRKHYPNATMKTVKEKIRFLRNVFWQELRTVHLAQEEGLTFEEISQRTSWLYKSLVFLKDHESTEDLETPCDGSFSMTTSPASNGGESNGAGRQKVKELDLINLSSGSEDDVNTEMSAEKRCCLMPQAEEDSGRRSENEDRMKKVELRELRVSLQRICSTTSGVGTNRTGRENITGISSGMETDSDVDPGQHDLPVMRRSLRKRKGKNCASAGAASESQRCRSLRSAVREKEEDGATNNTKRITGRRKFTALPSGTETDTDVDPDRMDSDIEMGTILGRTDDGYSMSEARKAGKSCGRVKKEQVRAVESQLGKEPTEAEASKRERCTNPFESNYEEKIENRDESAAVDAAYGQAERSTAIVKSEAGLDIKEEVYPEVKLEPEAHESLSMEEDDQLESSAERTNMGPCADGAQAVEGGDSNACSTVSLRPRAAPSAPFTTRIGQSHNAPGQITMMVRPPSQPNVALMLTPSPYALVTDENFCVVGMTHNVFCPVNTVREPQIPGMCVMPNISPSPLMLQNCASGVVLWPAEQGISETCESTINDHSVPVRTLRSRTIVCSGR